MVGMAEKHYDCNERCLSTRSPRGERPVPTFILISALLLINGIASQERERLVNERVNCVEWGD